MTSWNAQIQFVDCCGFFPEFRIGLAPLFPLDLYFVSAVNLFPWFVTE